MRKKDFSAIEAVLLTMDEIRVLGNALRATGQPYMWMSELLSKIYVIVKGIESHCFDSYPLKIERKIINGIKGARKLLKGNQPSNDILEVLGSLKDKNDTVGQAARKLLAFA